MAIAASKIPRRNLIPGLAIGIPASLVFLYLATRGIDAGDVERVVRRARLLDLVAALAVMALVYPLQAARWRLIARGQATAPFRTFLRMVLSAVAVNNVVPGRPGEVLRGYWLSRESSIRPSRAIATVVVDRASDVLVLVVVLIVGYPFVHHASWLSHLALAALVVGAVVLAVIAVCLRYVRQRSGRGRAAPEGIRARWVGRQLSGLVRGTAASVNRADAAMIGLLTVAAWGCFVVSEWLVAASLGIAVSAPQLVFVAAVINLGVALPSSPGFIGTYQWLCVTSLALFGVGDNQAFAFSILLHALWFVPTTLAGLAILLHHAAGRLERPALAADAQQPRRAISG
ncbi:MAG: glycosyltransferase 2 family protein [Gaiellales bacterium]|jgi:uncharacterized protein (TIRG00374 family)|nr:glycosyltransferase 2 family protein [Gaiellales bacterium]MDX6544984.1 glycosyltransferase 2 family protein [Gaiellales bacterium]